MEFVCLLKNHYHFITKTFILSKNDENYLLAMILWFFGYNENMASVLVSLGESIVGGFDERQVGLVGGAQKQSAVA